MTPHDPAARCRELFSLLSEYLDGDLAPDVCAEMDGHMEGCAPCVAFLESLRRTITLLRRFPGNRMPAGVKAGILAARDRTRHG